MNRRRLLATCGAVAAASVSGCLGIIEYDESATTQAGDSEDEDPCANKPDADGRIGISDQTEEADGSYTVTVYLRGTSSEDTHIIVEHTEGEVQLEELREEATLRDLSEGETLSVIATNPCESREVQTHTVGTEPTAEE